MATVAVTKELIRLSREARVSLFLWGVHGIGKSSIVRQVADDLGIGFTDFRCAQIEASDLRGLPVKGDDGRTHFLPPSDLPAGGEGILFLDELNRSAEDVLAAAFQLVLDRRIGEYVLPEGWHVVCAGNIAEAEYSVTQLDPALRDRFCHVMVEAGHATLNEWAEWMWSRYGDRAASIIEFCSMDIRHLEADAPPSFGFSVEPSRRSWEMAFHMLEAWQRGDYTEAARREALSGLIGQTLTMTFLRQQTMMSGARVFDEGVAAIAAEFRELEHPHQAAVMWSVIRRVRNLSAASPELGVALDFLQLLIEENPDLAVAYVTEQVATGTRDSSAGDFEYQDWLALLQNAPLVKSLASIPKCRESSLFLQAMGSRPDLADRLARVLNPDVDSPSAA